MNRHVAELFNVSIADRLNANSVAEFLTVRSTDRKLDLREKH